MKTSTLFKAQVKARSRFDIAIVNEDRESAIRYSRLIDKLNLKILKRLKMEEAVNKAMNNNISQKIIERLLEDI